MSRRETHKLVRWRFQYEWGRGDYGAETLCPTGFTSDDTKASEDRRKVTCKRCLRALASRRKQKAKDKK
jgi:hypothetical protein